MQNRIGQLDSIRGLAALTVVFGHVLLLLPPLPGVLLISPFRIFWAGHEAVILFFILSGFVLSLPFIKKSKVDYTQFFIRRVCRIYIPYVVAIIVALLVKNIFFSSSNGNLGWADKFWTIDMDFDLLMNHFLLLTDFNTDPLNPFRKIPT